MGIAGMGFGVRVASELLAHVRSHTGIRQGGHETVPEAVEAQAALFATFAFGLAQGPPVDFRRFHDALELTRQPTLPAAALATKVWKQWSLSDSGRPRLEPVT